SPWHPARVLGGSDRIVAVAAFTLLDSNGFGVSLSLWAKPRAPAMAMGNVGQRLCGSHLAGRLLDLLLVCWKFRRLQQDLWLSGRRDRLHDLDMVVRDCDFGWSRNQRRDGTSDRTRHHGGGKQAAWFQGSDDGGPGRAS